MSTPDFFRSRLDAMIDLRHPLAVLANRMPWTSIEATLTPIFEGRAREGRVSEEVDLFGVAPKLAGAGISAAGRPRLSIRLMVGLLYLKHAYNDSDEAVCERWAQDVYFQFFCGEEYFQPRLPCDPTNLVRFRQALGEAGVEELLAATIAAAVQMKAVKPVEFERVIVDTTVQEKAIAYPTDSRLLEVARARLVQLAQRAGLSLKQTYERESKRLRRRAGGLCACEAVQTPASCTQTSAYSIGTVASRHRTQALRCPERTADATARVARACMAHLSPTSKGQEEDVRTACA